MYENTAFPQTSPLIDSDLAAQLTPLLEKITTPLTLLAVVDKDSDTGWELAGFLNHFVSLSANLSCEFYAPGENLPLEQHIDCSFLPAVTVKREGSLQNVFFHGIPGGKEINAFVLSLYNCGGPGQKLSPFLKKKIEKLDKEFSMTVCVSLSCHHCANLVAACQYMALLNPRIKARAIDARLYPDFVAKEKIERVPLLIINGGTRILGDKSIEEVYSILKDL